MTFSKRIVTPERRASRIERAGREIEATVLMPLDAEQAESAVPLEAGVDPGVDNAAAATREIDRDIEWRGPARA